VKARHSNWADAKVVQQCKNAQKKLRQCIRKLTRMDKTLKEKDARAVCRKRTKKAKKT
jgi:hypothetical protein